MKIQIRGEEFTEVWDGVLYKKLAGYPKISPWELRTLFEFIAYEKRHGRDCLIECADGQLLEHIKAQLQNVEIYKNTPRPALLTECTACPVRRGCDTEFVCHTTSAENAVSILKCGRILSAVGARGVSAQELAREKRNAANDPEDYFEYVMLAWGNCQAGDRLVMERKLGRFPNEEELSAHFTPGIRFYFRYDELAKHPGLVFDGVLPMKIRDEIELEKWLDAMVIPSAYRPVLEPHIPAPLKDRAIFLDHEGEDIWAWAEKVFTAIKTK